MVYEPLLTAYKRSSNWLESHLLGFLKDFDSEETDYFYRRKFNPVESIPICKIAPLSFPESIFRTVRT